MPETPVTSLGPRLQRQFENARTAFDRGNTEYAINLCREVLAHHPGCLPVRRLLRATQLKAFRRRNPFFAKLLGLLVAMPALANARALLKKHPARALAAAERALDSDPTNLAALRLLARAAAALDLPETAVFALETVREHSPHQRAALVELADAYIAADRSRDALAIGESLLGERADDHEVQELIKRASVAQSITAGRWDSGSGTFRDKLRDEQQAVSIEQSNKVVASADMTQRLVNEAVARVAAEPANLNHYRTIVGGFRTLGRFDDALSWLGRARALPAGAADPTLAKLESELRIARGEQQLKQRNATVAASGADPAADAEVRRLRDELGRLRLEELRALVEFHPNEQGYRFDLGVLYEQTGELDLAIQQFQLVQRSPKLRLAALAHLGACFKAKGLHDLAAQQYETAKQELVAVDEEKKEVVYQLATCYEAMGRADRALEEFKLIYSWDIAFRDVAARIGSSYTKS